MTLMFRLFFIYSLFSAKALLATIYAYALTPNYVTVIDTSTNTSVNQIHLPAASATYGIATTPDGHYVYVADVVGHVYVIDTTINLGTIVKTISGLTSGGTNLAITPDGTKAYITATNSVNVIDMASQSFVTSIALTGAAQLVITPDSSTVYVTVPGSATVRFIHTATNTLDATVISAGSGTGGNGLVTMTADGSIVYVNNGSTLSAISTTSNTVVHTYSLGSGQGRGMGVTPDGTKVYVGSTSPNTLVYYVNIPNNTVASIVSPSFSYFIAVTPDGSQVLTGGTAGSTVPIIKTALNTSPAPVVDLHTPALFAAGVTPDSSTAYFPALSTAEVMVLNLTTETYVKTITIAEAAPTKIVMTPLNVQSTVHAVQIIHDHGTVKEKINQITWGAVTYNNQSPLTYSIYRDIALTQLVVSGTFPTLMYLDHNRIPNNTYSYYIVANFSSTFNPVIGSVTITDN